jgi:hypothetical protein
MLYEYFYEYIALVILTRVLHWLRLASSKGHNRIGVSQLT